MAQVSESDGKSVVIVGAGIAGLTAAERLISTGVDVTVIEREERVGGLARSSRYDGVTFDIGPHRFHTDDEEVERYVREVLGPNQRMIDRSSAVWLFDAYHDWPLGRSSLLKLPPLVMIQAGLDLFRRPKATNDSLEDYVLSRYGKTLYDIFFKPYTEKFLTYRCRELHKDWASAGINRAVIDQRYRFDNLFHVARTTLLPPAVTTQFIYPDSGGIDQFVESLAERIRKRGGRVLTSAAVEEVETNGDRVEAVVAKGVGRLPCDQVIWTAPLPLLAEFLDQPSPGLRYLTELIFNVVVRGGPVLPYQWTYYGGAALSFMRASQPSQFSPSNNGPGKTGICLEVVCQHGDNRWEHPEQMRRDIAYDLVRVGLVERREDIEAIHVERVPEVYPIYVLDYPSRLRRAIAGVAEMENVLLLGRTGTFWYNNMDHSIRQAMDLATALNEGSDARQWNAALEASRAL